MYSKRGIRKAFGTGSEPHEGQYTGPYCYTALFAGKAQANKKSFSTGDPENSGFSRIQLVRRVVCVSRASFILLAGCRRPLSTAYFRKYWSPALLFSRNLGLNLDITLFGGSVGTAASKLGNVLISWCRKSSNSE